jgi:hypothetical protein
MKMINMVKRFILGILLMQILSSCNSDNRHWGTWVSTDEQGRELQLVFHEDSTMKLSAAGNVVISDEPTFVENGEKLQIKASLNQEKEPMDLDLVMYINDKPDDSRSMRCLLNMKSDDELEFQIERNSTNRPAKIDTASPGYQLFKRVK